MNHWRTLSCKVVNRTSSLTYLSLQMLHNKREGSYLWNFKSAHLVHTLFTVIFHLYIKLFFPVFKFQSFFSFSYRCNASEISRNVNRHIRRKFMLVFFLHLAQQHCVKPTPGVLAHWNLIIFKILSLILSYISFTPYSTHDVSLTPPHYFIVLDFKNISLKIFPILFIIGL